MLNIVPVGVGSGVCTFTTASGTTFLEFDVPKVEYPHGTLEAVVGWTSWIYAANPLPLYVELQLWHDGGEPHMLQSSVWSFSPSQAVTPNGGHAARDLYPVMLPDPGHKMHHEDRLFLKLRCPPLPGKPTAKAQAFATFYLRVME